MARIVLTTLNAKYIHAAFGLRYLLANLGPLREQACLVEFDLQQRPLDVVETILAQRSANCRAGRLYLECDAGDRSGGGAQTGAAGGDGGAGRAGSQLRDRRNRRLRGWRIM